jgi:hypothetical protein
MILRLNTGKTWHALLVGLENTRSYAYLKLKIIGSKLIFFQVNIQHTGNLAVPFGNQSV